MTRLMLVLLTLFLFGAGAQGDDPALDARARALGSQLRCPVCRGLPISESPAELARSMMSEVRAQLSAGRSEAQVQGYFVEKYGSSVLLAPPKSGLNLVIWLGPLLVVALGGLGLASYLRSASRRAEAAPDPAMLERVRADLGTPDPSVNSP